MHCSRRCPFVCGLGHTKLFGLSSGARSVSHMYMIEKPYRPLSLLLHHAQVACVQSARTFHRICAVWPRGRWSARSCPKNHIYIYIYIIREKYAVYVINNWRLQTPITALFQCNDLRRRECRHGTWWSRIIWFITQLLMAPRVVSILFKATR